MVVGETNPATFTVFITLPSQEVCSVRRLSSGVTIKHIQCRLELLAGLPSQIYQLVGPQGKCYQDDHVLVLNGSVWDGVLFRVQLKDPWSPVYEALVKGDVKAVVRYRDFIIIHFQFLLKISYLT